MNAREPRPDSFLDLGLELRWSNVVPSSSCGETRLRKAMEPDVHSAPSLALRAGPDWLLPVSAALTNLSALPFVILFLLLLHLARLEVVFPKQTGTFPTV